MAKPKAVTAAPETVELDLDGYRTLVKELVDMRELEGKATKNGENYEAVRRVRRESESLWKRAREAIYGPEPTDAKPRTKAEAERWARNAERVKASRQPLQE